MKIQFSAKKYGRNIAHVTKTREIKITLHHAQREQRMDGLKTASRRNNEQLSMDRYKLFVVNVV